MLFISTSTAFAAAGALLVGVAQATFQFDQTNCLDDEQAATVQATLQNLNQVLAAMTDPTYDAPDDLYRTYFGNGADAQEGFAEIKRRFTNVNSILNGNTDMITVQCGLVDDARFKCKSGDGGASAYVGDRNDETALVVTVCPPFFNDTPHPNAIQNGQVNCAGFGGTRAAFKPREQVLLHEFMHVGITTTEQGTGLWNADDRIIDCVVGVFLTSRMNNYENGFEVARINADSYAYLGWYKFLTGACPNNAPRLINFVNLASPVKVASDRCLLGDLNPGAPGVPLLTQYSQDVRNTLIGRPRFEPADLADQ